MSAENILVSVVSKGNCIWYLTLADKYHTSELQKAATRMIVSNLAEVRKTEDWVTIRPNLKERVLEEISNRYNLVEKVDNGNDYCDDPCPLETQNTWGSGFGFARRQKYF